ALWFTAGEAEVNAGGDALVDRAQHSPDLFNAALAILLTILGTAFILFPTKAGIGVLRPQSLSLLLIWIVGTRILYLGERSGRKRPNPTASTIGEKLVKRHNLYWPILIFASGSAIIFLVAPLFADCAKQFAAISGWGDSFVGTWLL